MAIDGPASRASSIVAVAARPSRSVPRTLIVFAPATSGTVVARKVPLVSVLVEVCAVAFTAPLVTVIVDGSRFDHVPLTSIAVALVVSAPAGDVMLIVGRFLRNVTRTESLDVRPAPFLARATTTLRPAARRTLTARKVVPVTVAAEPF